MLYNRDNSHGFFIIDFKPLVLWSTPNHQETYKIYIQNREKIIYVKRNYNRMLLIIFTILVMWIYIGWRGLFTIPAGFASIPGVLLFLGEWILIVQQTIYFFLLYRPTAYSPPPIGEDVKSVDVLITTYNESISILKRTIIACKNLDYPKEKLNIWVCDDGRRHEIREFARELGVRYLDRPTNEHAKAGNLNHALAHTDGELIVTIDADMVVKPYFLVRTAGFFHNPNVAFVQTPQAFFNEDIFQFNSFQSRNIPNEQDLFMQIIQAGRDRFNAAIYVGSNAVFRRSALDSIGGFATGTITEDMATGMLLQAKGYKTIAYSEVLAQGLASESLRDLLSQRIRWARGTIQTMRKWNPLTTEGLSLMQRILYVSSLVYWYFGVCKFLFIISPIIYLLAGIPFLEASLSGILWFWLPYFLMTTFANEYMTGSKCSFLWSNIYETAMMPTLAKASIVETLLKTPISFNVTPKGVQTNQAHWNLSYLRPHLVLIFLSIAAGLKGAWDLHQSNGSDLTTGIVMNEFWLVFNLIVLLAAVLIGYERPRFRNNERFHRRLPVRIANPDKGTFVFGETLDISESGCSVHLAGIEAIEAEVDLCITGREDYCFKGKLVFYDAKSGGYQASFKFIDLSLQLSQRWNLEVYGDPAVLPESVYKTKLNIISIGSHFYRNQKRTPRVKERKSPRLHVDLPCSLYIHSPDSIEAAAEIASTQGPLQSVSADFPLEALPLAGRMMDIGLNGASITVEPGCKIKQGDPISVLISEYSIILNGTVIRTVLRNSECCFSIKFQQALSGALLTKLPGINK